MVKIQVPMHIHALFVKSEVFGKSPCSSHSDWRSDHGPINVITDVCVMEDKAPVRPPR